MLKTFLLATSFYYIKIGTVHSYFALHFSCTLTFILLFYSILAYYLIILQRTFQILYVPFILPCVCVLSLFVCKAL